MGVGEKERGMVVMWVFSSDFLLERPWVEADEKCSVDLQSKMRKLEARTRRLFSNPTSSFLRIADGRPKMYRLQSLPVSDLELLKGRTDLTIGCSKVQGAVLMPQRILFAAEQLDSSPARQDRGKSTVHSAGCQWPLHPRSSALYPSQSKEARRCPPNMQCRGGDGAELMMQITLLLLGSLLNQQTRQLSPALPLTSKWCGGLSRRAYRRS